MTLAPTISAAGITSPQYADILSGLQDSYYAIYGSDVNLDPATKDGQWLAILAKAIYDCGQSAVAAYYGFSPVYAQGAGLSSIVKINGLSRGGASYSTVVVTIGGTAGAVISGGLVGDNQQLGTQWALPASVTIPESGTTDVTATCTTAGAVAAAPGTLTKILTPSYGWQTVTNASAAASGLDEESDAALRYRQSRSTGGAALTPLGAIYGALAAVNDVGRIAIYANDTDSTDADGRPAHSVTCVVEGGASADIAAAIATKKAPGVNTYGTTSRGYTDPVGVPITINYYQLDEVPVFVTVTIKALSGYVAATGALIQESVAAFISQLGIGVESYLMRLVPPANLSGDVATAATGLDQSQLDAFARTYNVTSVVQGTSSGSQSAADSPISFYQAAAGVTANVTVIVT
jgi:uncharacterized phage protein gp47/JayE